MRDVVIAGIGQTDYGTLWEYSLRDLSAMAVEEALESNKIDKIDSIYVGNFSAGTFVEQEHIGALVADYTGFMPASSTRIEAACASGSAAFRTAFNDVASGMSEVSLVLGVEKMTDVVTAEAVFSLSLAGDREYEGYQGATFPALFALIAKSYMYEFNMPRRALSLVAVKNHENAYSNPKAQFHKKITTADVESSTMVAYPLTLYDCSPITDGASALILMSMDKAKSIGVEKPIKVSANIQKYRKCGFLCLRVIL